MELSKKRILLIAAAFGFFAVITAAAQSFEKDGIFVERQQEPGNVVSFQTEAGTKLVAVLSEEEKYTHASASDAGTAEYTININTASAGELDAHLPGIGEKKAQAIVEYRERIGGFSSVEELIEVEGIGPALLDRIRPYCTLDDGQ